MDKYIFTHVSNEEGKETRKIEYTYSASDFELYTTVVEEFSNFLSSIYGYKIHLEAYTDSGKPLDQEGSSDD